MNNRLAKQYNFRGLLKFSLPTIVMMVFMSLYTIVDGLFVSRLVSTHALSSVNIVYPIVSVVIALGVMFATGGSAIVARKMGEGKQQEARQDFSMIIITGVLVGLAVTVLGLTFLEPILYFLGANEEIIDLCQEYAAPLLLFMAPAMLQMLFQMFFVTSGKPEIGLITTVIGGVTNIALDYLFIAVYGWGITGAAIATGIGYIIPGLFGLLWFAFNRKGTLYFVKPVFRGKVLLHTVINGSSEFVTNLSAAIITYLFNIIMMSRLGVDGVAAVTIVLYVEFLLIAAYMGYSDGIAPIISYNHGEGNIAQLKRIFKQSIWFLAISDLVVLTLAVVFAKQLVGVFSPEGTHVFDLAVHGYYLYAFSYLFKGINIFASALFTALSNGKVSAGLSFLRTLVFIIIGMLVLPLYLGTDGVWLAVPFAETLSLFFTIGCFIWQFKTKWNTKPATS